MGAVHSTSDKLRRGASRRGAAPRIVVPCGGVCWRTTPFLPRTVVDRRAYSRLLRDLQLYGVTRAHVDELFVRLCSPTDSSLGTVKVDRLVNEFDPPFAACCAAWWPGAQRAGPACCSRTPRAS
jgi:hypothetical protein